MRIFLSVPFSSHVTVNGSVEIPYQHAVQELLSGLREHGHEVYCALEYANWTMGGMHAPEDELRHDFSEIDKADTVVVLLEERVSAGSQLENGYAFAKGKSVEVYQVGKPAWSNEAFAKLNGHEIVPISDINDFVRQVLAANQPVESLS